MSDLVGRRISHYSIVEKLGSGGMGMVYRARDLRLERTVALKFLPPDLTRDAEAKARFLREARATSSLQHRNICVVYDIDESEDAQMFISMECLEGDTLEERLKAGPLPLQEAVNIATQIAEGLAKAHESGIVHRDVKPANIMIVRDGSVKILDFGLAMARSNPPPAIAGALLGTVAYMSPEQARGEQVDQRSDIWSLGVILYEMTTGHRPFPDEYAQAVMYAVTHEKHPPARTSRPEMPLSLEKIIDRCLAKSPGDRFQDAGALLEALRRAGSEASRRTDPSEKSIAVLPFSDLSPEKDNRYFSDGLTEEIISKLSRLQNVKIVSRSSVRSFEGTGQTTRQIAEQLNVQYLLEGSVRKHGSSLRITTQLIDAARDAYLWSETYNGTMEEIFDIQEDVAGRILRALKVRLTPDEGRTLRLRATGDTEAYQLYLRGRFFWSKRSKEGVLQAKKYFQQALERDPQYAAAWAGIADVYLILSEYVDSPHKETYPEAKAAVRRALEIDGRLAEAHTSLGLLVWLSELDWVTALREFRLAISESPSYATAHHWYAELLVSLGKTEEGIAEITRAVELDPLSPAALRDNGLVRYYARDYDGAIEYARKALDLDPSLASSHRILSLAYQAKAMYAEAIAEHELWIRGRDMGLEGKAALAQCYAVAGRREEARELLAGLPSEESAEGNLARGIALVHAALGEKDRAFAYLDRAYATKGESMMTIAVDPKLDPLRSDPRLGSLLSRIGLGR